MSKYDVAYVFTKKGNLLPYFKTDKVLMRYNEHVPKAVEIRDYYAEQREIRLVASFRWENIQVSTPRGFIRKHVCYCRIKCPVNPLPVKGEFEVPSIDVLISFLSNNGWIFQEKLHSHFLE